MFECFSLRQVDELGHLPSHRGDVGQAKRPESGALATIWSGSVLARMLSLEAPSIGHELPPA